MDKYNLRIINHLFVRDIKHGFHENKYKYLGIVIIMIFISILTARGFNLSLKGNFVDVILGIIQGIGNNTEEVEIPVFWILINSYLLFIVGSYAYDDYKENYIYIICRANGVKSFWISKLLWIILNVVIYYIIVFGISIAIAYLILGGGFEYSAYTKELIIPTMINKVKVGELIFTMSACSIASWVSMSLLQVSLSIMVKPINAFIIVIIFLIIGIFIPSILFPTQYSMIMRNEIFDSLYNITLFKSLIYNFIISIIAIFIGFLEINKKELI